MVIDSSEAFLLKVVNYKCLTDQESSLQSNKSPFRIGEPLPHALTPRQHEYLEFIRGYIKQNESSPRLEEIAEHFGVKSPTAHKTLKALFAKLFQEDVQLITGIRKNMQNRLMPWADKLLLRKRAIIETINDQLKNISQIEHSRHRSFVNFFVNLLAGLIAYCLQPKKPSLHIHHVLPATIH